MKTKILRIVVIGLAVLITGANGGYLYYQLQRKPASITQSTKVQNAPVAQLKVKSAKQVNISAGSEGKIAGEGSYSVESLSQSRINSKDLAGKLVMASYEPLGAHFVLASGADVSFDSSNIASDWQATTVSTDSLWAPAGCSAKPTLLLKGRYIFIDDGKTKPTDMYNSYLSFDIQTGKYNYFGGDKFTDTQAKHENIILATNENDDLVFYIDVPDAKGVLANSTSFKHSVKDNAGYIIRRVIDPATMHYTDYHIGYTAPSDINYFYLNMYGATDAQTASVNVVVDSQTTYTASIKNNALKFTRFDAQSPVAFTSLGSTPPYDTALEKHLDAILTTTLPDFAAGTKYMEASYVTNFAVTELGTHDETQFIIARSRNGTQNETPAVIEGSKVYPLTTQPFLALGGYVPLGVY